MTLFFDSASNEVSESQLLQELIYSFQGIDGKYLKLSPVSQGYKLDPKVCITIKSAVLYLPECNMLIPSSITSSHKLTVNNHPYIKHFSGLIVNA
jgi:hypothetical protein